MRRLFFSSVLLLAVLSLSMGLKAQDKGNIFTRAINGIASYYHDKFEGRKTATGDVFDNDKFTAASNKFKLNSYAKVTNLSNGQVVYVKINDHMAHNGRVIDLASIAAKKLEFEKKGVTQVKVEAVPAEEGRIGILAQNGLNPAKPKNEL